MRSRITSRRNSVSLSESPSSPPSQYAGNSCAVHDGRSSGKRESAAAQDGDPRRDGYDGFVVHLANHDVTLMAVSRAPLAKLQAFKRRMGWAFPWASALSGDFNFDFDVSITEEQQRERTVDYNYRRSSHPVYVKPE